MVMEQFKSGITTGTCATAAAYAAAKLLIEGEYCSAVTIDLPGGESIDVEVESVEQTERGALARVRKYSGDDPDITNGALITVEVCRGAGEGITFIAGEGVGVITKPGLQLAVNEPAINPVPREMISKNLCDITNEPLEVKVSVENGRELAQKTFNPRLGIEGGISIIGTIGIVRPFSTEAVVETIRCAMSVASSSGIKDIALVPGHLGRRSVLGNFTFTEDSIIEVSNEWGAAFAMLPEFDFKNILIAGHPGKLVKLAMGYIDTHSKNSPSALPYVLQAATKCELDIAGYTGETVEGFFQYLDVAERRTLGDMLAESIVEKLVNDYAKEMSVVLLTMDGTVVGGSGDYQKWQG